MAILLSSKKFSSSQDDFLYWIGEFIDHFTGNGPVQITVTVSKEGARQRKLAALQELEEMAAVAALKNKETWTRGAYKFFFLERKYYWNDREIHITANEALFLFRWLVLDDETHEAQRFYLRNMRSRLGKYFLKEVKTDDKP